MKRIRIIPVLLLHQEGLVKSIKFKHKKYVGDPINTVKLFNDKEVDELAILDISATLEKRQPSYEKIQEIAGEAFMPMAYGGGISSLEIAKKVFDCGFEKIILNSSIYNNIGIISQIANEYGSQSVVVSIDVKKNWLDKYRVYSHGATKETGQDPVRIAKLVENEGAGEIILNSIHRDGTWNGYDLELIQNVSHETSIPIIAVGGAGCLEDFRKAVDAGASAVAAGSMFIYQRKGMGVLINFPKEKEIIKTVYRQ